MTKLHDPVARKITSDGFFCLFVCLFVCFFLGGGIAHGNIIPQSSWLNPTFCSSDITKRMLMFGTTSSYRRSPKMFHSMDRVRYVCTSAFYNQTRNWEYMETLCHHARQELINKTKRSAIEHTIQEKFFLRRIHYFLVWITKIDYWDFERLAKRRHVSDVVPGPPISPKSPRHQVGRRVLGLSGLYRFHKIRSFMTH